MCRTKTSALRRSWPRSPSRQARLALDTSLAYGILDLDPQLQGIGIARLRVPEKRLHDLLGLDPARDIRVRGGAAHQSHICLSLGLVAHCHDRPEHGGPEDE